TLAYPKISEAGRRFLADLLVQLTDHQLHDLFDVARVRLRPRDPHNPRSGFPSIDEWVEAFKAARRNCRAIVPKLMNRHGARGRRCSRRHVEETPIEPVLKIGNFLRIWHFFFFVALAWWQAILLAAQGVQSNV